MRGPFNLSLSPFGRTSASLPYMANANTYLWNFTKNVALNGPDILRVGEMSRGDAYAFEQTVAASQPASDANGALFTGTESMAAIIPVPVNASTGLYVAELIYIDATPTGQLLDFLQIYNDASGWPERFTYGTHFGNQISFDGSTTDSGGPPNRGRTSAGVSKSAWHLVEMKWNLNSLTEIKIDQVAVTASSNAGTDTNFQSGDSSGLIIGGAFSGVRKATAIYDGVIPADNQTSIADYLMSLKP